MFLNKKSFICFLTAGLLVLTGCQAQNASSQPINPSTSPSNSQYYNENNFEKDARKVTATPWSPMMVQNFLINIVE